MSNTLISIICPVYNSETFLEECILSVINQTDKNWELFLIDDGSKDNSGFLCDIYSKNDSRIKVIHKANCGQMQARIDGIELCNGNYIMFLDSDDLLKKDAIEIIRRIILNNESIDAFVFNACTFPKNKQNKALPFVESEQELITNTEIIKYTFGDQMFGYLWMYCFNKSILLDAIKKPNPYKGVRYTEDGAFIYNVISICNSMKTISSTLYLYRDNANSITHNITEKDRIDRFCVFEYIYGNIFVLQKDFAPSAEISLMVSWAMFSMLSHIKYKKHFKEMFKKARNSILFRKICNNVKINNRQFNLYRLLLRMNCSSIFYRYSHK